MKPSRRNAAGSASVANDHVEPEAGLAEGQTSGARRPLGSVVRYIECQRARVSRSIMPANSVRMIGVATSSVNSQP